MPKCRDHENLSFTPFHNLKNRFSCVKIILSVSGRCHLMIQTKKDSSHHRKCYNIGTSHYNLKSDQHCVVSGMRVRVSQTYRGDIQESRFQVNLSRIFMKNAINNCNDKSGVSWFLKNLYCIRFVYPYSIYSLYIQVLRQELQPLALAYTQTIQIPQVGGCCVTQLPRHSILGKSIIYNLLAGWILL